MFHENITHYNTEETAVSWSIVQKMTRSAHSEETVKNMGLGSGSRLGTEPRETGMAPTV